MASLHIRLLGTFQIRYQDAPVTAIYQPRQQSLLAYLILRCSTAGPQPRRQIAYTLWPDTSEEQAFTNLRRELHHLRQALPEADQLLQAEARALGWQAGAACEVDVAVFEEHLAHAQQAGQASRPAEERRSLEQAAESYGGDLLPDCYDDWIQEDRERLGQSYQHVLERLILLLEEERQYAVAIGYAERLLRSDRFREATYRQLMRLHLLNGDRPSALRTYHTCSAMLAQELGVEPSSATQDLYQRTLRTEKPSPEPAAVVPLRARPVLIGRQAEWQTLRRAWEVSSAGKAQFVCIAGEPGIGKTRLVEEMLAWVGQQGYAAAYTRAYAAEGGLAYDPISEWLRAEPVRPRVGALADVWQVEVARLLPELLVDRPDLPHPQPLAEGWQRRRFFEALARGFLAVPEPLLLVLDDLQWCDRETIEWLHYLLRFDPRGRLLVVGTVRPEEVDREHPLTSVLQELRPAGIVTELEICPLDAGETARLAARVAGGSLDPAEAEALHRFAEGNPLFIVEMLRSSISGARVEELPSSQLPLLAECSGLPAKIQAVVASRLARLSPAARALAELAAAVGRSFTFEVLRRASGEGDDAVMAALDELWRRRIVRVQGQAQYDFSHDLVRQATYCGNSPTRLRLLHHRVAQALEQVHGTDLDRVSGEIAVHYERAGMAKQAIPHYQRAAEAAQRLSAHAEAIQALTREQALLVELPDTSDRKRREFTLQLDLAISLVALKGIPSLGVKAVYERAYQLGEQIGDDSERLVALQGLYGAHLTSGELKTAYELAQRELALAQGTWDPSRMADAHLDMGIALLHLGQWGASRGHLERWMATPDYQWHPTARLDAVPDAGIQCRRHLAAALWHLGYPDQALIRMDEALALSEALVYPYILAGTLVWSARLHRLRGEGQLVQAQAGKAVRLCRQHGYPFWLAFGKVFQGWALTQRSDLAAGLAEMQDGLAIMREVGAGLQQPECLCLLAEGYGRAGQPAHGLRAVDEALATVETIGVRFAEAELHRLKGELLSMQGADEREIEACFLQALAVARQQEAKSLELRAALSLGRLWQGERRLTEAYALLSAIYNEFTEGWETADLRAARDRLAELAG